MKIERPEYIGLMCLHAARWHLEKALEKPYNRDAIRKLRTILPYAIDTAGNNLPGSLNRNYRPLGLPGSGHVDKDGHMQYRFPRENCRLWTRDAERTWLFHDGNPPWKNRACAERYLAALELLVDFTLPEPPAQGVGP